MKCQHCGRRASQRAQFCEFCGKPLTRKESPAQEKPKETNWLLLATVLIGGVLFGAIVMYVARNESQAALASAPAAFDPKLHGPELASAYPEVYQVAAEFICPCGTCTDGLEVCDCEMVKGASEVRQFIFENLGAGHLPPHVIEMVEAKYGYRKTSRPPITFENLPAPTLPTNQK